MKKITIAGLGLLGLSVALGLGTEAHAEEVQQDGQTYWKVEAGDTLSAIGNRYGMDYTALQNANQAKIPNAHLIYEGDLVLIPTGNQTVDQGVNQGVNQAPIVQEQAVEQVVEQPVQEYVAPVQEQVVTQQQPVETSQLTTNSAKEWIAQRESNGSYTATNGQYIGRYQLSASYLNGDYSAENQERVADEYVAGRYGSWEGAQAFWVANGWY